MTAKDKYPIRPCENLSSPFQMQLPLKPKTSFPFFIPFHEFTSNFKDFEKKDDRHSYFVSEIKDWQRLG